MKKIGCIGLGNMGRGVCHRLIESGTSVVVYDVSKEAAEQFAHQAEIAPDVKTIFDGCDVIFLSLPNSKIVESTIEQALDCSLENKIIVDMSTSNPISTRALYQKLKERGCALIDAPLSSGPQQAWEGTMQIVVAGDSDKVEQCDPLFRSFCSGYDYVGDSGNAHLIKLAKNWAGLLQAMLYAQLYPTMERLGIPAEKLYHILDNQVLANWIFHFYGEKFVKQEYPMDFALALGYKDICYMRDLCNSVGAPAYMLDGAVKLCEDALAYADSQGVKADMSYVCAQVRHLIEENAEK